MSDHAERALGAARAMIREIDRLNRELVDAGTPSISVGIGLDNRRGGRGARRVSAPARVHAHRGAGEQQCLSVEGEAAKVLMSETTRDSLPYGLEVIEFEPLQLKGSSTKQPIYQLQSP